MYVGTTKVGYVKVTADDYDTTKHNISLIYNKDVSKTLPKLNTEDYQRQFQTLLK